MAYRGPGEHEFFSPMGANMGAVHGPAGTPPPAPPPRGSAAAGTPPKLAAQEMYWRWFQMADAGVCRFLMVLLGIAAPVLATTNAAAGVTSDPVSCPSLGGGGGASSEQMPAIPQSTGAGAAAIRQQLCRPGTALARPSPALAEFPPLALSTWAAPPSPLACSLCDELRPVPCPMCPQIATGG